MSTNYYIRSANSDLTGGADWNKQLTLASGTPTGLDTLITGNATETSYAFTNEGVPGLSTWTTGNYQAVVNVTASYLKQYMTLYLTRVSSTGSEVDGPHICDVADQEQNIAGLGNFTFDWTGLTFVGSDTDDRLRVSFEVWNDNHADQTYTISVEGTNTVVVTAWTSASSMGSIAMHGYRLRRN